MVKENIGSSTNIKKIFVGIEQKDVVQVTLMRDRRPADFSASSVKKKLENISNTCYGSLDLSFHEI